MLLMFTTVTQEPNVHTVILRPFVEVLVPLDKSTASLLSKPCSSTLGQEPAHSLGNRKVLHSTA